VTLTIPYTYLIGWPEHNRYYYGVRFAEGCHPSDLWKIYKTSSKTVHEFVKMFGDPTHLEIRKTFKNVEKARLWENKVLKRMKVVKKEIWLNKTDNKSIAPSYGNNNSSTRPEIKSKISNGMKKWYSQNLNPRIGNITPDEVKEKQSLVKLGTLNPFYGKKHKDENIKLFSERQVGINNSFYGKKHSEESKIKMSDSQKGKAKPTSQCPHCGKVGGINTMPRWHFDNCKEIRYVK
jgi:hypothetical protein